MNVILTVQNFVSDFVVTAWTPIFVGIFLAIVAYALWLATRRLSTRLEIAIARGMTRSMNDHSDVDKVTGTPTTATSGTESRS